MIEWSQHLLSKVVPPSERAYATALTQAYALAVQKLTASSGIYTQKQLRLIIKEITDELYGINEQLAKSLPNDIAEITAYDNAYISKELELTMKTQASIYALPKETIKELADLKTLNFFRVNADGVRIQSTVTADAMLNSIAKGSAEKIKGVIMAEHAAGTSVEGIAKKLRPFMTTEARRNTRTVIRTLLSEASSKAQQKFYTENSDFVDGYIFVSVLDSRVTEICRNLDGRRFKTRAVWYTPPLHVSCRSSLIAVPNDYQLGQRPIVLKSGEVIIVKDKGFTYKDALKLYPELSNKKLINMDQYIKGLGLS